jgi:hypothetical protein
MTATDLSHVASPRECDTRQTRCLDATEGATGNATTRAQRPSIRQLARDTLVRHGRDKELERRATALRQAIDRCCDARGDDDVNRAALIQECSQLPPDGQADMLEHFQLEAIRFRPKTRAGDP